MIQLNPHWQIDWQCHGWGDFISRPTTQSIIGFYGCRNKLYQKTKESTTIFFTQPQFTHRTPTPTNKFCPCTAFPPTKIGAVCNCAGLRQEITESPRTGSPPDPVGACFQPHRILGRNLAYSQTFFSPVRFICLGFLLGCFCGFLQHVYRNAPPPFPKPCKGGNLFIITVLKGREKP